MMPEYYYSARFYDRLLSPFLTPIRRRVLALVRKHRFERILDVCCGTGDQLKLLKKYGIDGVGVDLSEAMLSVARQGDPAADCILEDATRMHYEEGRFDLVMAAFALHEKDHDTAQKMVEEIYRVTAEGGSILIVDYELSEKTSLFSKTLIHVIERLAGREHYRNFRAFNRRGGLPALLSPFALTETDRYYFAQHGVVLVLLQKGELPDR